MKKTKHNPQPGTNGKKASSRAYGKPKKDMGGYIGERNTAGDRDNPESLPGGA